MAILEVVQEIGGCSSSSAPVRPPRISKTKKITAEIRDSFVVPVDEVWYVTLGDGSKWKNDGGSGWTVDASSGGGGNLSSEMLTKIDNLPIDQNIINGQKISISEIVDNLGSFSDAAPLSANQGRVLKGLIDTLSNFISSDDTNLDQLQEIVDYIKLNRSDLDSINISSIPGLQSQLDNKTVASDFKSLNGESLIGTGNITINSGPRGESAFEVWQGLNPGGTESEYFESIRGRGVPAPINIEISSDRNILESDVNNRLRCTQNSVLTLPIGFSDMSIDDNVGLVAVGTIFTVTADTGVVINNVDGGSYSIGNGSATISVVMTKIGVDQYEIA